MNVKESWVALLLGWMFAVAGADVLYFHFNISWVNPTFSQSRAHLLYTLTRSKLQLCLNLYCPIQQSLATYG